MNEPLAAALSVMAAFGVALAAGRLMMAAGLTDPPDAARKLHRTPTPTAGGLGIMAGAGAGFALFASLSAAGVPDGMTAVLLFGLLAGALGLVDDMLALGARPKLVVMVLAAFALTAFGPRAETLGAGLAWMSEGEAAARTLHLPAALAIAGSALWLLVLVNAVNFIDGANGVAMGSLGVGLVFLGGLSAAQGAWPVAALAWTLAAGCGGFLVWNAPAGRLFSGDCGALGAGALAGGAGLLACEAGVSAWAVALCFLPILADAILTVAWRARQGHRVTTPHKHHAYQVAVQAGASHGKVALLYAGLTFHCGLSAVAGHLMGPGGALIALAVNALIAWRLYRRARTYAEARGLDAV